MGQLMGSSGLEKVLVDELKDIYNAEQQILQALPKMIKAAESDDLQTAFAEHRKQTEGHVVRLEKVFDLLGQSARTKKCSGMEGLLEEGAELMKEEETGPVLDACLIAAAQKVEHYEIAAYGTVRRYAELLGLDKVADLMEKTLNEEKETDERLSELAEEINVEAEDEGAEEGDDLSNGPAKRNARPTKRVSAVR
jgi:ferritin-like metal-binding protein YciE